MEDHQPSQKERFLCTFNSPWTHFGCQWTWKKTLQKTSSIALVNAAVNRLDDTIFDVAYPGGGRDIYHPKMLTKVIIYAYTQRIYSSRQIAKAIRENIPFKLLAGRQSPDFQTINRLRSERMKDVLETVFTAVIPFLADEKYISLEHYFVDGTKIEANANRYTFVWGKAVKMEKAKAMLIGGRQVQKIAQDLGYEHRRYFSEGFKKYTGMTPSDFKLHYLGKE